MDGGNGPCGKQLEAEARPAERTLKRQLDCREASQPRLFRLRGPSALVQDLRLSANIRSDAQWTKAPDLQDQALLESSAYAFQSSGW